MGSPSFDIVIFGDIVKTTAKHYHLQKFDCILIRIKTNIQKNWFYLNPSTNDPEPRRWLVIKII